MTTLEHQTRRRRVRRRLQRRRDVPRRGARLSAGGCAAATWVHCPRSSASSCCSSCSGSPTTGSSSALNLANLVTQAGSICVLAMGLVFVLLLGDIDLSAGVAGGVSACAMALDHRQPRLAVVGRSPRRRRVRGADRAGDRRAVRQARHPVVRGHAGVFPWAARRHAQADRRGRLGAGRRSGDPGHHDRQPVGHRGLGLSRC